MGLELCKHHTRMDMNILLLGAAGFIGTNLAMKLSKEQNNRITLIDRSRLFFRDIESMHLNNVVIQESTLEMDTDFDVLLSGQDIVYHLVSTTVPTTSNKKIPEELMSNLYFTLNMLEACRRCNVKRVVFISSGGTVYGKESNCPLNEDTSTYPINSYGIQKITIEKILYLYHYMYGIDYRVIRLANPYGPYQRPNGVLGAVTTFTYKALKKETIEVYGDGSVVRDFIYIEDAVKAIINIASDNAKYKTYNVGCGYGTSINEVLNTIKGALEIDINIEYKSARNVDVPINYLDIERYEKEFGKINSINLENGVKKTAEFMKEHYDI